MKIRFLLHDVYPVGGGVLTVTFNLAKDLSVRHDVEVVSVLRTADQPVKKFPEGVRFRSLVDTRPERRPPGPRGWVKALALWLPSLIQDEHDGRSTAHSPLSDWRLWRYLQNSDADVIIGMQPGIGLAIARYGRPDYVRVVQDHRPFRSRRQGIRDAYRRHARELDAFITLTPRDARHARKELGDLVRVVAIGNGCPDYTGRPPDYRQRVVVAAGRLSYGKGFDLLIRAWAQVARQHPDWSLRIFGEGRRRAEFEELIAALGLGGSVSLMGHSTTLLDDLVQGSIFVLSSRREGFGMVLIEAMACGLPVVSMDCPNGPRAVIGRGGTSGVLVRSRDVDALASAIADLINAGPQRRRQLGTAASERARQHNREVIARRWVRLLRRELHRKRGAVGRAKPVPRAAVAAAAL